MPPAISDEENSEAGGEVEVTLNQKSGRANKSTVKYTEDEGEELEEDIKDEVLERADPALTQNGDKGEHKDEDEEEEDDEEGDEYVVEKIISHFIDDAGTVRYEVKWEGYDKKADRTWEPEEHLEGNASAVLAEYLGRIGGRDKLHESAKNALKTKKRGRPSTGTPTTGSKRQRGNGHPASSTPPLSSTRVKQWKPPSGSWEDEVDNIDACEDEESNSIVVYLTWKNGAKTQHPLDVIYKRCPQKMLRFYERHVRIIKQNAEAADTKG